MKLVIDISKEDYERLKEYEKAPFNSLTSRVYEAITNGTLLPKGHGRLIDANDLIQELSIVSSRPIKSQLYILREAQTIIEADTADRGDKK